MMLKFFNFLALPITALSVDDHWTIVQETNLNQEWKNLISDNYLESITSFEKFKITKLDILPSRDTASLSKFTCKTGHFFHGDRCRKHLSCDEMTDQIAVQSKVLARGIGKSLSAATWRRETDEKVAFVQTRNRTPASIQSRVKTGVENLLALGSSPHVQKVYGSCFESNRTFYVSEFCSKGNLAQFSNSKEFASFGILPRIAITISLVEAFHFLHNTPDGARINCDMNRLHRSLTQFLVTDDYRVVLNDVDDVPLVSASSKCSRWAALDKNETNLGAHHFDFLAPEQKNEEFLTEKVDIWKIPDMILHLLLKNPSTVYVKKQVLAVIFTLRSLLQKCKSLDPEKRPDASEILDRLYEVRDSINRRGW